MIKTRIIPEVLHFKKKIGTSRAWYTQRKVWYITVCDTDHPGNIGWGEAAPLPLLSIDDRDDFEEMLKKALTELEQTNTINRSKWKMFPSILFAIDTALQHLYAKSFALWDTPFSRSEQGIQINGLIWMGDRDNMLSQIEDKLKQGFKCIKLKIGAIHWNEELSLLESIRREYSADLIELRVDANGAFSPNEALNKLHDLSAFDLHSIEQPIKQGQINICQKIISQSPIPIALDEELIGIVDYHDKENLIKQLSPHYLIIKPSLIGGFKECEEWITLANTHNIKWWITSALESNIGLNAIAQWTATLNTKLPQGLGTGALFINNINLPLKIKGDRLWFKD